MTPSPIQQNPAINCRDPFEFALHPITCGERGVAKVGRIGTENLAKFKRSAQELAEQSIAGTSNFARRAGHEVKGAVQGLAGIAERTTTKLTVSLVAIAVVAVLGFLVFFNRK